MLLGDLRQAHAGATVSNDLLAIHVESRTPDLPSFCTGASHTTSDPLDQQRSLHLAQHRDDARNARPNAPDVSNASRNDTN